MEYIFLSLIFFWILLSGYAGICYSRKFDGNGKKIITGILISFVVLICPIICQFAFLILTMAFFFGTESNVAAGIGIIGYVAIFCFMLSFPLLFIISKNRKAYGILKDIFIYSGLIYLISVPLSYLMVNITR